MFPRNCANTYNIMMAPAVGFGKTIYYNASDLQMHTCNDYDTGRSTIMVTLTRE